MASASSSENVLQTISVTGYTVNSMYEILEVIPFKTHVFRINTGFCIPRLEDVIGLSITHQISIPTEELYGLPQKYVLYWRSEEESAFTTVAGVIFRIGEKGGLFEDIVDTVDGRRRLNHALQR
jgi:hypothetical protein